MSVRFRLMTVKDIPEGMRLKDIAGWNQTGADWERFLSASPEGCFVVECDDRVVGTSTTIVYEDKLAWIGMVLVDPRYRGRGIGMAILERAIRYLDSRNIPCMKLDATPQGRPLYEKFGFVGEYDIERWMLEREPAEQAAQNPPGEIEGALQLDLAAFGADRGMLLRRLAEEAPELTLIAQQRDQVAGYAFGRRGSLADHLGPWMARDEHTAARLLDSFLDRSGRGLLFVDCLRTNPWAIPLVKARGFGFSRPLTRMFRGRNLSAGQPEWLCAILGPEFG